MIRRPPRSTLSSSSAASDVYKRQSQHYPELKTKLRKHCSTLIACQIASIARSSCLLPVQKQLSRWWLLPEQLLFRCKICWRRKLTKELDAFARPKSPLLLLAAIALPAHRHPMRRIPTAKSQYNRHLEYRVVLRKDSLRVRDIPSRKVPFEADCGAMMLREKSE